MAELLASELVTNALVHTDGGAVVRAHITAGGTAEDAGGRLRVEVRDFLPRPDTERDAWNAAGDHRRNALGCDLKNDRTADYEKSPGARSGSDFGIDQEKSREIAQGRELNGAGAAATSGRGLLLVHSLADGWGVRAHAVGKAVWFELDAREP
ncbi:ATP-binding protein [Streptomyces stramineus]|uniref:ATP-binding protein n=1 Tax=Streptomyces stramineus TaxID=173861 RepID=UPI003CD0B4E3